MIPRNRRDIAPVSATHSYESPGSLVHAYAKRRNWPLARRNVMLEGKTDREYFKIADDRYQRGSGGRKLICSSLSLFQVGDGESGGTENIRDKFVYLREVLSTESFEDDADKIMAVVLMDNDKAGRDMAKFLEKRHFKIHRDVFLIARVIPRVTRETFQLSRLITEQNAGWSAIDCEIEDLLSPDLLELFAECEPSAVARAPVFVNGGHHYEWTRDGKARLLRFVQKEASAKDVDGIIELLKSLRFLLRLDPDGSE